MTYLSHVFAFVAFLCKTSPFCPSVHVSVQCRILYLQQSTGEGLSVESREGPRHGTTSSREGKSRERENHRMRLVNRPAREREREKKKHSGLAVARKVLSFKSNESNGPSEGSIRKVPKCQEFAEGVPCTAESRSALFGCKIFSRLTR